MAAASQGQLAVRSLWPDGFRLVTRRSFENLSAMRTLVSILLISLVLSSRAADLASLYATNGELIVVSLPTAPFPHPNRAEGHKYKQEFFSAKDNYSDSTVGIFIPKNFQEGGPIDFVVHFHGWKNNVAGVLARYKLIEQLVASRRNAILVVPQGPKNAPDSFGGKLEDAGGFKAFMADVTKTLSEKSSLRKKDFAVGKIILSGHSGGYQVISSILDRGGLTPNVQEVWLFDALYAQTDKFSKWFEKSNGRLLNIYTEHGGTKDETEKMMESLKAEGIKIAAGKEETFAGSALPRKGAVFLFSDLEHNDVVDKHRTFEAFLKTSFLGETRDAEIRREDNVRR